MTGMAEMEVSPQEDMTNPQDIKVFTVERHRLPEDFVSFCALRGVQSSSLVFAPNRAIVWGPLQWQAPVETLCFRFAFSRAECSILDDQTLGYCVFHPTWTLPLRALAETVECASRTVEDGGGERFLRSECERKPVSADQMYPTHAAQSPRTHESARSTVCGS